MHEQDGPFERVLKERLAATFSRDGAVSRAYLAKAEYSDGSGAHVILGLRAGASDESRLAREAASIFTSIFHASRHLDILFLPNHEEKKLAKVCRPFFDWA
ncbi:MAG: enhanced serine sensitivity protein SseB C-terminal domain-containing protein [Xanthobacteraceae bacterium]